MTISTSYAPDTYAGTGSQDTFAITFAFLSTGSNVKVSIKVDSTGVITEKTAGTHYNVSGSNVVFTAGNFPASGETVILELNPDFLQSSDYAENSRLPAETLETDLDERTLESQYLLDQSDRSLRVDSSEDISSATLSVGFPSSGTEVLTLDSAGTLATSTVSALGALNIPVTVDQGGTGATSLTSDAVLTGNGTSAIQSEANVAVTSGVLTLSNGATSGGQLALVEDSDNGSNAITLQAPDSIASSFTLKLPNADGTANYVLETDGSGNLGWVANSGGLSNIVEDTTPQLGGDLDLNGNQITSPDGTDLINIPNGSIDLQTASTSRLDITDSGVRLGAANARVTTVLDEDTMSSDSATALATQQSIKAYVDSQSSAAAAAKVWGRVSYSAGTPTLENSVGVSSITDTATGKLTINFSTNFADTNFAALSRYEADFDADPNIESSVDFSTRAVGSVQLHTTNAANSAFVDPTAISFAMFGDV